MIRVDRVNPRGEIPGEKLKAEIEAGFNERGETLAGSMALFDEILLIWDDGKPAKPKPGQVERRDTTE